MSDENLTELTESSPDESNEEGITPSHPAQPSQGTHRRSIQPGIIRQNAMHSMNNDTVE